MVSPPRHTRKSTGKTVRRYIFEIGHIHYLDSVTAYGEFRIENYCLVLFREFNCNVIKTVAVKAIR